MSQVTSAESVPPAGWAPASSSSASASATESAALSISAAISMSIRESLPVRPEGGRSAGVSARAALPACEAGAGSVSDGEARSEGTGPAGCARVAHAARNTVTSRTEERCIRISSRIRPAGQATGPRYRPNHRYRRLQRIPCRLPCKKLHRIPAGGRLRGFGVRSAAVIRLPHFASVRPHRQRRRAGGRWATRRGTGTSRMRKLPRRLPGGSAHEEAITQDAVGGVQDGQGCPAGEVGVGEIGADQALAVLFSLYGERDDDHGGVEGAHGLHAEELEAHRPLDGLGQRLDGGLRRAAKLAGLRSETLALVREALGLLPGQHHAGTAAAVWQPFELEFGEAQAVLKRECFFGHDVLSGAPGPAIRGKLQAVSKRTSSCGPWARGCRTTSTSSRGWPDSSEPTATTTTAPSDSSALSWRRSDRITASRTSRPRSWERVSETCRSSCIEKCLVTLLPVRAVRSEVR